jgi:hypothetical protein
MSVFDNDEFQRGFIEFYDSEPCKKYLHVFLSELIERHRAALETADDAKSWQAKLKAVRFIKDQAAIQKQLRAEKLSASMKGADAQGEQH